MHKSLSEKQWGKVREWIHRNPGLARSITQQKWAEESATHPITGDPISWARLLHLQVWRSEGTHLAYSQFDEARRLWLPPL